MVEFASAHSTLRRLAAYKFRRQAPIGPYVADFVCFAARLVVEVDGGQHATLRPADLRRDRWFAAQGFRLLRWNNEVLGNLDGVLQTIAYTLAGQPSHAQPSPSTGEGGDPRARTRGEPGEGGNPRPRQPPPTPTSPEREGPSYKHFLNLPALICLRKAANPIVDRWQWREDYHVDKGSG